MNIVSYGKVHALGHRDLDGLLNGPVTVQEKYDGSQMSWAWDHDGHLHVRSRSRVQYGPGFDIDSDTDALFRPAVAHLLDGTLPTSKVEGLVFRGEAIVTPKHNTITYSRCPDGGIVLFDVELPDNGGMRPDWVDAYAGLMGLEVVRTLREDMDGATLQMEHLDEFLAEDSSLGGTKIEGVVIKNYGKTEPRSGRPFLAGKYVSERFKETHKRQWKGDNPGQGDVLGSLVVALNTEARWEKAVQHLAEQGVLVGTPQDIGALMKEVKADVLAEESEWIKEKLFEWAVGRITRQVGGGLPEWYKRRLAVDQFGGEA